MKKFLTLAALLTVFSAPAFAGGHTGEAFAKRDTDGNGSVSKAEFRAYTEGKFKKMDADGNGEISKEEAKAHRKGKKAKMKEKMKDRAEKRHEKGASKSDAVDAAEITETLAVPADE